MSTRLKAALARGYQVAVYAFVGTAGVGNIGPLRSASDLKASATIWGFALITALASGLVAFLVSTASNGAGGLGADKTIHAATIKDAPR